LISSTFSIFHQLVIFSLALVSDLAATTRQPALLVDDKAAGRLQGISVRESESDCTRSKRLLSTTESTAISSSGMPAQVQQAAPG
jgi:hypothetical protein